MVFCLHLIFIARVLDKPKLTIKYTKLLKPRRMEWQFMLKFGRAIQYNLKVGIVLQNRFVLSFQIGVF